VNFVVEFSMFKVTETEPTEAAAMDKIGSSEGFGLPRDVCYMKRVKDVDVTANHSLNECALEKPTQSIQSATTGAFNAIAYPDDISQKSSEQPKFINSQSLLPSCWTCQGPHTTQLQPLVLPEQMHPPTQDLTCSQPFVESLHAASISANALPPQQHHFLQPLLPSPSAPQSSGPVIRQQHYKPPSVTFTIETKIKYTLCPTEVKHLFRIFSRNTRLLLKSKQSLDAGILYSVEALMTQTSTDFYKWYTVESKAATKISVLRFKLLDCDWYAGETILVSGGNLCQFQLLKQLIWDYFWLTFSWECAPFLFHVYVSHLPDNVIAFETMAVISAQPHMENPTTVHNSSFQDPRPPHVERKSNIHNLLNPINVNI